MNAMDSNNLNVIGSNNLNETGSSNLIEIGLKRLDEIGSNCDEIGCNCDEIGNKSLDEMGSSKKEEIDSSSSWKSWWPVFASPLEVLIPHLCEASTQTTEVVPTLEFVHEKLLEMQNANKAEILKHMDETEEKYEERSIALDDRYRRLIVELQATQSQQLECYKARACKAEDEVLSLKFELKLAQKKRVSFKEESGD